MKYIKTKHFELFENGDIITTHPLISWIFLSYNYSWRNIENFSTVGRINFKLTNCDSHYYSSAGNLREILNNIETELNY